MRVAPGDLLDQVVPHFGDWRFRRTIEQRLQNAQQRGSAEYEEYATYAALSEDQLRRRLGEEKDRAIGIASAAGIYLLDAAYLAIHSMRMQRLYGYGSNFLLDLLAEDDSERKRLYLAKDLWSQEQINHRRYIRNEAVYLTLRNGYVLIVLAAVVSIGGLIADVF